jgi:flavin reductase (DIM6/NTAB) family NADH-FMN oxidoreductase RutF
MSSTDVGADGMAVAVGRIPSGVGILTARHHTESTGMLASWFQQAAFEPLMVSVAVKSGRPIGEMIENSAGFVINVVGKDDGGLMKHFGKGFAPGEKAFDGLAVEEGECGISLRDALSVVECTLSACVEAGDHTLFVGKVVAGRGDVSGEPFVHVRKSGRGY